MASIKQRGNSWLVTISNGYDSSGKKLIKTKTFKKPHDMTDHKWEKELEKLALEFELQVERGLHLDGGKLTFADFTEIWLRDYAERNLAPKTLARYKELLSTRIVPTIGHIRLEKLQPSHLLEFYDNLSEDGIRLDDIFIAKPELNSIIEKENVSIEALSIASGISARTIGSMLNGHSVLRRSAIAINNSLNIILKRQLDLKKLFFLKGEPRGLSGRTILHHHRLISSMLTTGVHWQLVTNNVASRVKPPKTDRTQAEYYDETETGRLLTLLEGAPLKYKVALHIVIFGGLRLGEVSALTWDCIDFKNNFMQIRQSAQYIPGQGSFIKDTKNATSDRIISMPASVLELLKQYKAWQSEEKLRIGDSWNKDWDNNKWIFTKWNGERVFHSTISHWFRKFREGNELPKLSFHQLRHTNASLLIGLGTNIQTVSKRLGHSRTSTTTDIYAHALQRPDREAADNLEGLFDKSKSNKVKQA